MRFKNWKKGFRIYEHASVGIMSDEKFRRIQESSFRKDVADLQKNSNGEEKSGVGGHLL